MGLEQIIVHCLKPIDQRCGGVTSEEGKLDPFQQLIGSLLGGPLFFLVGLQRVD